MKEIFIETNWSNFFKKNNWIWPGIDFTWKWKKLPGILDFVISCICLGDFSMFNPIYGIKYRDYLSCFQSSFCSYNTLIKIFRSSREFETIAIDTIKKYDSTRELIFQKMMNNPNL